MAMSLMFTWVGQRKGWSPTFADRCHCSRSLQLWTAAFVGLQSFCQLDGRVEVQHNCCCALPLQFSLRMNLPWFSPRHLPVVPGDWISIIRHFTSDCKRLAQHQFWEVHGGNIGGCHDFTWIHPSKIFNMQPPVRWCWMMMMLMTMMTSVSWSHNSGYKNLCLVLVSRDGRTSSAPSSPACTSIHSRYVVYVGQDTELKCQ